MFSKKILKGFLIFSATVLFTTGCGSLFGGGGSSSDDGGDASSRSDLEEAYLRGAICGELLGANPDSGITCQFGE